MCAIFGWIGSLEQHVLSYMADSLAHRGPDGSGEHFWSGGAMGMKRLAIVDAENGDQPFYSPDGTVTVVCNGEIYNWRELRDELENLGHEFQTESDIEVLPAAWLEWGESMLERLNGMFALALRDKRRDGVFLARDRCGQKPLYYSANKQSGEWVFASEPVGLFSAGVTAEVDPKYIPAYLLLRYVPEPDTLYEGVKQLSAGHCGWLTSSGIIPRRWWDIQASEAMEQEPSIAHLEATVSGAVDRACAAEVPSALYLSAGVDSTLLLHMLQRKGLQVQAVTAGFDDDSDEVECAAALCDQLGVEHHAVLCSAKDLSDLPRVVAQMQVPVGDALVVAFDKLAAKVSEIGCKVAFGGDGVDELFQGYSFQKLQLVAEKVGPVGRFVLSLGLQMCPLPLLDKVSGFPASLGNEGKKKVVRWLRCYSQSSDWWKGCGLRTLFEPKEVEALMKVKMKLPALPGNASIMDRHDNHQYEGWLQDWSIIRQERNAMAHSLEYRMPFLDNELIDESRKYSLSQKLSLGSGKIIWRKLATRMGISGSTGKQPFYYPVTAFLENAGFKKILDDCLSEDVVSSRGYFDLNEIGKIRELADKGEFIAVKKLVALVVFELWLRSNVDADC